MTATIGANKTAAAADALLDSLMKREGGYVDNPDDAGAETAFGVTVKVAREEGYAGPMSALTRDEAKAMLSRRYWTGPGLDRVAGISPEAAAELFDTGVNMGPATAGRWLQRSLNALNRKGRDWPDVRVDGQIGGATLDALAALVRVRGRPGEAVLLKALNCLQGARYIELTEAREANESFAFGWLAERVGILS